MLENLNVGNAKIFVQFIWAVLLRTNHTGADACPKTNLLNVVTSTAIPAKGSTVNPPDLSIIFEDPYMKAEYPNRIPTGIILSNGPTTHNTYVLKEVCDIHSPFPEYVRCSNYLQHLQTCVQL